MADGKYYWLKLRRDFFDRRDIQLIEKQPDGAEIVLFYLKLMTESIDHEGRLRFNENRPYTREDLAIITRTDIKIVEQAMEILYDYGLLECDDDKTLILPKVETMIGSAADNDNARRQQRYRDKQKQSALREHNEAVTKNNESKREEIEIEKEIKIDNCLIEKKTDDPETIERCKKLVVQNYILGTGRKVNVNELWEKTNGLTEYKGEPIRDWKRLVDKWAETDIAVPF